MKVNNQSYYNPKQKVAFNGAKDYVPKIVVNGLVNLNKKVKNSEVFKDGINYLSAKDKSFSHLLVTESTILSGSYMVCIAKNDKIDKKQKPQMIMSDALTLTFSTLGAYFLDEKLKNSFNKFTEKYFEKHKEFYTDFGKNEQMENGKTPLDKLLDKVKSIADKKGGELQKGLDDISNTMGNHLKNITGKKEDRTSFCITKEELVKAQEKVKNIIKTSKSSKEAKKAVSKSVAELYNSSFARTAADLSKPWFSKIRQFSVFAVFYRLLGPDISTFATLRADKKREKLAKDNFFSSFNLTALKSK